MRRSLWFSAVLFAAFAVSSPAGDAAWTYAPPNKDSTGVTNVSGVVVSPTYTWVDETQTSFGWSDNSLQIGATGKAASHIRYDISFSSFGKKASKIIVTAKGSSALNNATVTNKALVSASVAGTPLTASSNALTNAHADFEFSIETPEVGDVVVEIDSPLAKNNKTSYAIYLRSIVIIYDDGVVVDPWEPIWTVDEPSPAPRVGTAFSFGVSAVLENGTPQTVTFGGLTPAATGAQPTFANGLFSWTPGEDAAGAYTAAFSVTNDGGTYTTNVAITVKGATEEDELFFETFSKCTGNWGTSNPGAFNSTYSDKGYAWSVSTAKRGYSGMRLGNKSDDGTAVTPTIHPANDAAGTVFLSFVAAGWDAGDRMTVSVSGSSWSRTLDLTNGVDTAGTNPLPTGDGYSFGPYEIVVSGPFTVSFQRATGDGRMGIDSVRVTQTISTSQTDLDVPTGFAVVDGTLSTNSFSVAWNAVENATAYTVALNHETGSEPFFTTNLATTTVALAGLADDTTYRVRVRAEGDTTLYNFSDWTNITVHTMRSALHPTLSFGPWSNAAGENKLYGVLQNTAAVSAALDDTTPVEVVLTGVAPAPSSAPTLAGGTLSWTPAAADEGTSFTLTFEMTPAAGVVYTTNLSFTVQSLPDLHVPDVTVAEPVAWNAIDLSWDQQYRAAGYAVRAWTDCPNPAATATRIEESFADFAAGVRPSGWTFSIPKSDVVYKDDKAPVKLTDSTHFIETYDLGGPISSVSFHAAGHSIAGSTSTLTVVGIKADGTETNLATLTAADIGQTDAGIDRTNSIPAGIVVRKIAWRYTKDKGGVGVGSVVIEGEGFSTARWLPGWGPAAKVVGLVQGCTVAKPRPGKVLGVNPANKKEDLTEDRINYAEVAVHDAAGATLATVVEVEVPAPPRSARATLLIFR